MTETMTSTEREDLLQTLAQHRHFLRFTVRELNDEQAARRTTVSELCVGGLIKHVANVEEQWVKFILDGPAAMRSAAVDWRDPAILAQYRAGFEITDGETLSELLGRYEQVARQTDEVVATLPSLDASQPLPEAPWFEKGARWTARRVLLHIIAETAQHAGHADIIREALDGQKTMG